MRILNTCLELHLSGYLDASVPGVLITVGGPGLVHALAGLSNAWGNAFPMIMISSSVATKDVGRGGFQELDAEEVTRPFVKAFFRLQRDSDVGQILYAAKMIAQRGRPGPVFLDIPTDVLLGNYVAQPEEHAMERSGQILYSPIRDPMDSSPSTARPEPFTPARSPIRSQQSLLEAVALLQVAENPLIVFGKGASYGRLEVEAQEAIDTLQFPILCTSPAFYIQVTLFSNSSKVECYV